MVKIHYFWYLVVLWHLSRHKSLWPARLTHVDSSLVPGTKGRGKRSLVSTVCACPSISQNSVSLTGISVTLNSVRRPIFTVWKMNTIDQSLCKRWQGSNENTQLFGSKNYPRICPLRLELSTWWCNFILKFTDCLEQSADHYHQSDIVGYCTWLWYLYWS